MPLAQTRIALLSIAVALGMAACGHGHRSKMTEPAREPIAAVLAAESSNLMKIPGVVGVYHGLMNDGKTEGIVVMLEHESAEARERIPKKIGGHPIRFEVSGKIRPLNR